LLIGGLMAVAVGAATLAATRASVGRSVPAAVPSPAARVVTAAAPVERPAFNFRLGAPGAAWTDLEPQRLDPSALVAWGRSDPPIYFTVSAQAVGPDEALSMAGLAETAKARLRVSGREVRVLEQGPRALGGLVGERFVAETGPAPAPAIHVVATLAQHGFQYTLHAWSQPGSASREHVLAAADEAFASFAVIDRERVGRPLLPAPPFASPRFGYAAAPAADWRSWPDATDDVALAEYGAWVGEHGALVVLPVPLLGTRPDSEALADLLLGELDLGVESLGPCRPVSRGGQAGCDHTWRATGSAQRYELRVLAGPEVALLVAAWTDTGATDDLGAMLDRVRLQGAARVPRSAAAVPADERASWASAFNALGLSYHRRGRYPDAAAYFRRAFDLDPGDPVLLRNVLEALSGDQRYDEALAYLERHLPAFPRDQDLADWRDWLKEQLETLPGEGKDRRT
jgi:tetratricopeptide (TPR) repeat protein